MRILTRKEGLEEILVSVGNVRFSLYLTFLTLDPTWSKALERFLDKVSLEFEELTVCELEFELNVVPRLRGSTAFDGEILMVFVGKKSEKDLGFSEY